MKASRVKIALAAGVIGALAGCGSSRLSLPPNGFHSPTHEYTVRQVEAAFAGHGVQLHKRALQVQSSTVAFLIGGRGAHVVSVWVMGGHPGHGIVPSGIPKKYWPTVQKRFHGNVGVIWVSNGSAVQASLHELH